MTVEFNRQTSGESASLPQYLGCNAVFDMRLRVTFLAISTDISEADTDSIIPSAEALQSTSSLVTTEIAPNSEIADSSSSVVPSVVSPN
jgi:hypothetical protein